MKLEEVGARVTTTITETGRVDIPLIPYGLISNDDAQGVADILWENHIQEDCQVVVEVGDLPPGLTVRKAFGEVEYTKADDFRLRTIWSVSDEEERVLMIGPRGNLDLWTRSSRVDVLLSDLLSTWGAIDYELGEMRSPK
jgi:hypothetical protein